MQGQVWIDKLLCIDDLQKLGGKEWQGMHLTL